MSNTSQATQSTLDSMLTVAIREKMEPAIIALVQLKSQEHAIARKIEFAMAFSALQNELPAFSKGKVINDKNGNERSRYVAHSAVMKVASPILAKHGFSISTTTRFEESTPYSAPDGKMIMIKKIVASSKLLHVSGHESEPSEYTALVDDDAFMSFTQRVGAATTYAKSNSIQMLLGVVTFSEEAEKSQTVNRRAPAPTRTEPKLSQSSPAEVLPKTAAAQPQQGSEPVNETPLPFIPEGSTQTDAALIIQDHVKGLPLNSDLIRNVRAAKKVAHTIFGATLPSGMEQAMKVRFREGDALAAAARRA